MKEKNKKNNWSTGPFAWNIFEFILWNLSDDIYHFKCIPKQIEKLAEVAIMAEKCSSR